MVWDGPAIGLWYGMGLPFAIICQLYMLYAYGIFLAGRESCLALGTVLPCRPNLFGGKGVTAWFLGVK